MPTGSGPTASAQRLQSPPGRGSPSYWPSHRSLCCDEAPGLSCCGCWSRWASPHHSSSRTAACGRTAAPSKTAERGAEIAGASPGAPPPWGSCLCWWSRTDTPSPRRPPPRASPGSWQPGTALWRGSPEGGCRAFPGAGLTGRWGRCRRSDHRGVNVWSEPTPDRKPQQRRANALIESLQDHNKTDCSAGLYLFRFMFNTSALVGEMLAFPVSFYLWMCGTCLTLNSRSGSIKP